jgi:hypothetical protein
MRAIPSETTVLGYYNNVCPRCGASLSRKTVNILIEGSDMTTQNQSNLNVRLIKKLTLTPN